MYGSLSRTRCSISVFAVALMLGAASIPAAEAQNKHISPAFEGWDTNPDKSHTLYFSYYNRNSTEIELQLGADNRVTSPAKPDGDGGQPTTFQPGRVRRAFGVTVPAGFKGEIEWTVSYAGYTGKAVASLNPLYWIEADLDRRGNSLPTSAVEPAVTVTLPTPATLTGTITDDGRPRGARGARLVGSWYKFRGPAGEVKFDPPTTETNQTKATVTTKATFPAPGTYVIRLRASDGPAFADAETTVTVRGSASN